MSTEEAEGYAAHKISRDKLLQGRSWEKRSTLQFHSNGEKRVAQTDGSNSPNGDGGKGGANGSDKGIEDPSATSAVDITSNAYQMAWQTMTDMAMLGLFTWTRMVTTIT